MSARPFASAQEERSRASRMRAPLLRTLWGLLAFEAVGGMIIFVARLVAGRTPGETLHVVAGIALTGVYAAYQWQHWGRVAPFRARLDYAIGLLAALSLALTHLTGFVLGLDWWRDRVVLPVAGEVAYAPWLSATHNIGSMLVLTFVAGHLGAVLLRDLRAKTNGRNRNV